MGRYKRQTKKFVYVAFCPRYTSQHFPATEAALYIYLTDYKRKSDCNDQKYFAKLAWENCVISFFHTYNYSVVECMLSVYEWKWKKKEYDNILPLEMILKKSLMLLYFLFIESN